MGLKKINYGGTNVDITPDADKIGYTNSTMSGVSNAKGALDNIQVRLNTVEQTGSGTVVAPRYKNKPLPIGKGSAKILSISNSLTIFPLYELYHVMNGIGGITSSDLTIRVCHAPGCQMETWLNTLKTNGACHQYTTFPYNSGEWQPSTYSSVLLRDAVSGTPWDVICLQVYPAREPSSTATNQEYGGSYDSYKDVLFDMVREIRMVCPNPNVTIAWIMIYPQASPRYSRELYMETWGAIAEATKRTVSEGGIDVVIPFGTAYANAVNTASFNGEEHSWLLRDGTHPGMGVSAYIGSCVFFETIIGPLLGKSILDISEIYSMHNYSAAPTYENAEFAVTSTNLPLIQKIAMTSICDMYNVDYNIDPIQTS